MTRGSTSYSKEEIAEGDFTAQMEKAALEKARKDLRNSSSKIDIAPFLTALENTSGIDQKKITLWREIYTMASADRELATIVYTNLYTTITEMAHHGIYGQVLTKYLERMNKSTDQLLKLAELVAAELDRVEVIDTDDVFDTIQKGT